MKQTFAFEHGVLATILAHAAIAPGDRLLVAVSGGADSTALLAVLDALRGRGDLRVEIAVAHLNHHMRGADSDRDAAAVAALARRFALPCFVGEADGLAGTATNREAVARAARFAFLAGVARDWGAARIALAHTRDDQAETVLLRLARGAGPASLGAMRTVRDDGVIRPLLEQPRAAGVAYLEARGLGWVEDASNADESFFRNRVRRRLLPLLEAELGVDVRSRLARLAGQLREESALAEQRIDTLLGDAPAGAGLALATVAAAAEGAPRLLHAWLARAGVLASTRQIESLLRVARGRRPSAAVDLGRGRTGGPALPAPGPRARARAGGEQRRGDRACSAGDPRRRRDPRLAGIERGRGGVSATAGYERRGRIRGAGRGSSAGTARAAAAAARRPGSPGLRSSQACRYPDRCQGSPTGTEDASRR